MPGHCRRGRDCTPGDPVASADHLRSLTRFASLQCRKYATDVYGRTVARCSVGKAARTNCSTRRRVFTRSFFVKAFKYSSKTSPTVKDAVTATPPQFRAAMHAPVHALADNRGCGHHRHRKRRPPRQASSWYRKPPSPAPDGGRPICPLACPLWWKPSLINAH